MKYIIIFIDEASHKDWIFLMKRKNESTNIIIKFFKLLNNLFGEKKFSNPITLENTKKKHKILQRKWH